MKRIIISLMVAIMAIGAQAQITWNVRTGAGMMSDKFGEDIAAFGLSFQSNIPISGDRRWVFSPTPSFVTGYPKTDHVMMPLLLGYKVVLGNRALFVPKIGPMVGLEYNKSNFMFGPSVELAYEIKHFVLALNGNFSLVEVDAYNYNPYSVCLSLGYKF